MDIDNEPNVPTPAIILDKRFDSLDQLAIIALSSSSSSCSSYTPQKRKKGGRAYGSISEVTPVNAEHPDHYFLNH
jgi:hypothetical protein